MKTKTAAALLPLHALILNGCYVYSAFQGARTLKPGEYSATPSASFLSYREDGESNGMTDNFGIQLGMGLPLKVNLTARYETLRLQDEWDEGYHYADLGVKVSVIPERMAIGIPLGLFFGEDIEEENSWQAHPTLFYTIQAHRLLDVNLSAKYLAFFDEDTDNLLAFTGGLGLRLTPGISFLPEIGFLLNPGEDGNFFHYGFGLEVKLPQGRR